MSLPELRDEVAFRWSPGSVATSTLSAFVRATATSSFGQSEYGKKSSWISFRVRKATRKQCKVSNNYKHTKPAQTKTSSDKYKCRKSL